ncbi:MAG: thiosulfate oxidation carrier protein SoxY [Methylococcales bacterium]
MTLSRRTLLKSLISFFSLTLVGGLHVALAAWPKIAFTRNNYRDTVQEITNNIPLIESQEIYLKAPELAENGAVVPVSASTTLADVKTIALVIEKNPIPLAAKFNFFEETEAFISARIKMAESCDVIVVVHSGNQYFTTRKFIKVTIGGCGG